MILKNTFVLTRIAALCFSTFLSACVAPPSQEERSLSENVDLSLKSSASAAENAFDYKSAAAHYRTLLIKQPDSLPAALSYGRTLRYSGQNQAAIDVLLAALEHHGEQSAILTELAKAYLGLDQPDLALRFLTRAAERTPEDWRIFSAIGVANDYRNDPTLAEEAYLEALRLSPDNPIVLNNYGLSLAQAGRLSDAVTRLRQAADTPRATAQIRQNLALALALAGERDQALRMAKKDLSPDMVRNNMALFSKIPSDTP